MPNAAPALGLYESLIRNANPIESYVAGANLRLKIDAVNSETAARSFQQLLDSMKVADERSINKQKMALATRELDIDAMNAETNRMNAMRGVKSAQAKAGMPAPPQPIFGFDEDGNMVMHYAQPATDAAPDAAPDDAQGPTDGEGDGEGDVYPLQPGGNGNVSLLPTGATAPPPPPGMAQPTGEPTRAAGAGPRSAPSGAGKMYVTGGSTNLKTGSNSVQWSTTPPKKPGQAPDAKALEATKNFAASWGLVPEKMTTDENGMPSFTFGKASDSKSDFSVSALSAESQKVALPIMSELATLAEGVRAAQPTEAQKMARVGVTNPERMTPELWNEGYARSMAAGEVDPKAMADLKLKAREFAAFMNLQFVGKPGYVPSTEATVMSSLGIAPPVPASAQKQPGTTAAGQPQTDGQPQAGGMQPKPANPADIAKYEKEIIPGIQKKINEAVERKDFAAQQAASQDMTQAQEMLRKLKAQGKQTATPGPSGAVSTTPQPDTGGFKPEPPQQKSPYQAKVEAATQKWETNKQEVFRVLRTSLTRREAEILKEGARSAGDPSLGIPPSGDTADDLRAKWLKDNADRLNLKDVNGNKPTMDSVMFVDNVGRSITMKKILEAALDDKRLWEQQKPSEHTAPGGIPLTITPKVTVGKPLKTE